LSVPIGMVFGWLADRIKAWKLMVVNLVLMIVFSFIYIIYMDQNDFGLIFGFSGMYIVNHNIYMLVSTIIINSL
jgi:nitrate/nitrite transporter NarK